MDDCNSICSPVEHYGGNFNYYARKSVLFNDFIAKNYLQCSLFGLLFHLVYWLLRSASRWARLDRCLVNPKLGNFF